MPRVAQLLLAGLLAGSVAGSLGGCHRGGGDAVASCGQIAAKFLGIASYDLKHATVDEATSRAVTDQLPAIRDALTQACSAGKWSEAIRNCLVRANDHVGFETCEQQLTDEQRRDLDRATRGNAETP